MYFLYRHIRLDTNQPFYIGVGKKPKKFWLHRTEYKRAYYGGKARNPLWRNVVNKTGYRVEILFESDDYELILQKEIEFIELYGKRLDGTGTLVNMTDGGDRGNDTSKFRKNFKMPPGFGQMVSERNRGKKASEETRKILSEMRKDPYYHKHLLTKDSIEKAKISRRNNLKEVIDVNTGIIYNSLPDGCEALGINLNSEHNRIKRKSKKATFNYINS
jgi:hypothetical protein